MNPNRQQDEGNEMKRSWIIIIAIAYLFVVAVIILYGRTNPVVARGGDLPPEGLEALYQSYEDQSRGTEWRDHYRIKHITRPDHPERINEIAIPDYFNSRTEDLRLQISQATEFWCLRIDHGFNSGARDFKTYIGKTNGEYFAFNFGGPDISRDEWWNHFGC
jgi:hypothetical protein